MTADDVLLQQWVEEYDVPGTVEWGGYEALSTGFFGARLGECRGTSVTHSDGTETRTSVCVIHSGLVSAPTVLRQSVVWHEFSHARAFNSGDDMNHDSLFRKYRREKPVYWLGDMLMKAIGGWWCRRPPA